MVKNRENVLKNSYNLLKDVKEVEEGGTYRPPEYPSLQQIKLELLQDHKYGREESDNANIDEEIAIDLYDRKDQQMVPLPPILGHHPRRDHQRGRGSAARHAKCKPKNRPDEGDDHQGQQQGGTAHLTGPEGGQRPGRYPEDLPTSLPILPERDSGSLIPGTDCCGDQPDKGTSCLKRCIGFKG